MKTLLTSTLLCAALQAAVPHDPPAHDIVDTAVAAGSFDTLTKALSAAHLVDTLKGDGPFTVFAPSDSAFGKLDASTLKDLLRRRNRDTLSSILTFHVVPGKLRAEDVIARRSLTTVNGQRLALDLSDDGLRVGGAKVVQTDIDCSNGVIHVIDGVLLPASDNLVEVAAGAGTFQSLLAAAKAAGLAGTLQGDGPFTVFAPTDEAFAKIPAKTLKGLLNAKDKSALQRILSYHVVPGRVFADEALNSQSLETVAGPSLRVRLDGGMLRVQDSGIVATDIQASNGVVHVIDTVLMPPAPPRPRGDKYIGVTYESPDNALARQFGLKRNQSIVLTRIVDDTNAERFGLQRYDLVVEIAGRPANSANFKKALAERDYDDEVEFVLFREGKRIRVSVPIGERH